MSKLTPKIILEGTRLTRKTDLAFALNDHPRIVGPRNYRYHSPLISAEWCGFTPDPWGRGPINFEPGGEEEARAMAHAAVLIGLTFFPLPLPPYAIDSLSGASYLGWPAPWASIVPQTAIGPALGIGFEWPAARYLVGNVVAFMPLGVLGPLLALRWGGWLRALGLGLLVSGAIELSQLGLSLGMGFPYRVADVDDLLLNALGTLLGYGVLVARRAIGTVRYRAR